MIVDDDEDIRLILKIMLECKRYKVVEAGSGEECLDKFEAVQPDLILLDITMTGIDGWEVCRQVKRRMQKIPVSIAIVSSRNTQEDIKRSIEYARADAYIKKALRYKRTAGYSQKTVIELRDIVAISTT
jgi:CheY-like chemotaxis protein